MILGATSEVIILAGGMGTRLQSIVSDVPKPMAPLSGRPFLEYQMDYWINQGIERFTLSIGYLGQTIIDHFGNEYRGKPIEYIFETEPLGTGGGLKHAVNSKVLEGSEVLVVNGDTWFEVDLSKLAESHRQNHGEITIALKQMIENDRYGAVGVNQQQKITDFGIKTSGTCYINGGCYLFNQLWLRERMAVMPDRFSLEQDFLMPAAAQGFVSASLQDVIFLDIGIPEDYMRASDVICRNRAI